MAESLRLVIDGSSGAEELELEMARVMCRYFEIWKVKQKNYGSGNISAMGKPGLVVRINDKIQRLKRFVFLGNRDSDEGELDAWFDIAGYGLIGVVVHEGNWPGMSSDITWQQVFNLVRGKLSWSHIW